jgi:hypothetical protein
MFTSYPTYPPYRVLHLTPVPYMRGEDVYALQTALGGLDTDGIFGPATDKALRNYQAARGLVVDGKSGTATQSALADNYAKIASKLYALPVGLLKGQLAHESGEILGNYSPLRPDNTYDAGVAQRNTKYTPPSEGFHVPRSIEAIAAHTREHYALYRPHVSERRAWELAAGAWNAPAFANYYAGVKPWAVPGPVAAQKFNEYVTAVTQFMVLPTTRRKKMEPTPLEDAIHSAPLIVKETKAGYKTTEFWASLAIAALDVASQIPTKDKFVATLLVVGYSIARGLAKAGVANVSG